MVDSVHSGYKHAATLVGFTTGQAQTLVSLPANAYTSESDEIDNSTLKYLSADFEWVNTAVLTVSPATIGLYLIPSLDDTNYPTWTQGTADTPENDQYFIGSFTLVVGSVPQREVFRNVSLPPGKFKVAVRNKAGIALALTGSSLKFRRWNYASQ